VQHPYVKVLSINVFNPGRAALVADALLCIQQREAFASLRYDIRLFVPDPESAGIGDALAQLLTPESNSATDAAHSPRTQASAHNI
jgi:DNA phosphorothioation-dependent restriction protein DptH